MIRSTAARLGLAAAVVIALPAAAAAQPEDPSPEGVEWHLVGYEADGEMAIVPWYVDATLLLEEGMASGSGGCNRFSGSYAMAGEELTFDEAFAMTRMACPGDQAAVEDGYLAVLPLTASWAIEDDVLTLSDAAGEPLLGFEQGALALTASDVAAIEARFREQRAELERLEERLDDVRIGVLRERIRTLEAEVEELRSQVAALTAGGSSDFSAAERTLLRGVPSRIRSTCEPLRGSGLPRGTLAAVRCEPGAAIVAEMAYYLMPYAAAERTFESVMDSQGVPQRFRCPEGRPSRALLSPYHATGCFVDGGRANLRFMAWAADCHELDVDGRRIREPDVYVAIEGSANRIRPLYEWATDPDVDTLEPVWRNIPHGGLPRSEACRGLAP